MIANRVGGVAMRNLPDDLAAIEVHRADGSVRWFEDRQSFDREATAAGATNGRRRRGRVRGRSALCFDLRDRARRVGRAAVARPDHLAELPTSDARHIANVREAGW